jgi:CHAT domain-containing protein
MARATDPDHSTIKLEDAPFTPDDLGAVMAYVRPNRPFVFLNACELAQGGLSITDIGGWAKKFVEAGASVFIGAYWSVYDEASFDFAKALYSRLLSGQSLGEAARGARLAVRSDSDPITWLAYTVFGDPFAKVED